MLAFTQASQDEMKLTITSSWVFLLIVSGVLANIMIVSHHCFRKCNRNSGPRYLFGFLPEVLIRLLHTTPPVRNWWSQWVVAANHWHSLWRWWSDTLWVTHKNVMTSHSCHVCLGLVRTDGMVTWKCCRGVSSAISEIWYFNSTPLTKCPKGFLPGKPDGINACTRTCKGLSVKSTDLQLGPFQVTILVHCERLLNTYHKKKSKFSRHPGLKRQSHI
jgi:hypothetical protein